VSAVLLDTGAFVMALLADPRLPAAARAAIDAAGTVAVGAVSFYEIGQKARLGKWPEIEPYAARLADIAVADGFHLLPLTPATATRAATLDWSHRDPFDRIVAAQSLDGDWTLLSPDTVFDDIGVRRLWA
jgi:PIN domain nuclease of toxin-antitoxin system